MADATDKRDPFDLDTAESILHDLNTNVVPWIDMAERLRTFLQIANANRNTVDYQETSKLLIRVIIYVEQYCKIVGLKLDRDRYRRLVP
jgi:hypothetical protein